MNDTKERENAYIASCAAVERQQEAAEDAADMAESWRKSYLVAVISAATESEKLRRKKDQVIGFVWVGIILIVTLITLIFFGVGWAIGVLALSIGAVVLARSVKGERQEAEYIGRKEFFTKYHVSLPWKTYLKWSGVRADAQNGAAAGSDWICPRCRARNARSSAYCTACGWKMP